MEKEQTFLPYKILLKGGEEIPFHSHPFPRTFGGRGCGIHRIYEEKILGCQA